MSNNNEATEPTPMHDGKFFYKSLLDALRQPLVALAEDFTIQYCNDAYATLFYKRTNELIGNNLIALFPDFKKRAAYAAYRRVFATGIMEQLEGKMFGRFFNVTVLPTPWGILVVACENVALIDEQQYYFYPETGY